MCIVLNHCVHCVHISMQGKQISRHGWIDDSASSIIELKKKAMSYAGAVFTPAYTNTKSTLSSSGRKVSYSKSGKHVHYAAAGGLRPTYR